MSAVYGVAIAVVARVSSSVRAYHETERDSTFQSRAQHAAVRVEGSLGGSALGAIGYQVRGVVEIRVPESSSETSADTLAGNVESGLSGWSPTVSGHVTSNVRVTSSGTAGNRNNMRLWRIGFECYVVASGSDGLVIVDESDISITPIGDAVSFDLNVAAVSARFGNEARRGTESAEDKYPSFKPGGLTGSGTFILTGDSFPPETGTYSSTLTLKAGVTKAFKFVINEWAVLLDAREGSGLVFFVMRWTRTQDGDL